jgi:hypothetical protein
MLLQCLYSVVTVLLQCSYLEVHLAGRHSSQTSCEYQLHDAATVIIMVITAIARGEWVTTLIGGAANKDGGLTQHCF